jgi:copper chaperone NosL
MSTKVIKGLLLAIALVVVVVAFVRFNQVTLSDGPVPVVWDREVCANCKMHVGDPRFAAQLQTTEGDVLNFDDPGCLLDYLQANEISVHGLYFRNHAEDGWLPESEVGFLPVEGSPMGYGIRAVSKDTPEAQGIDWAKARVMERPHHQHGGS